MPSFSVARIVGLLAVASMLSGCSGWHWWSGPWPRIDVDSAGLGESPIADCIRKVYGYDFKPRLVKCIAEQTPAKGLSRQDAVSLGMQCAPAPSTECIYSGEYSERHSHPLPGHKDFMKVEVRMSYLKPQSLVVHVREDTVPLE